MLLAARHRADGVARGILAADADLVDQKAPRRVAAEPDVAVIFAHGPAVRVHFLVRASSGGAARQAVDGFGCEALPAAIDLGARRPVRTRVRAQELVVAG